MSKGARLLDSRANHTSLTGTGRSEVRDRAVEVVEVKRYWPGKAPAWAADQSKGGRHGEGASTAPGASAHPSARDQPRAPVVERRKAPARVLTAENSRRAPDPRDEEEEDDLDARRAKARARILERGGAEEEDPDAFGGPGEDGLFEGGDDYIGSREGAGEESESEYETDDSEEDSEEGAGQGLLLKPMFVRKDARQTAAAEEEAAAAAEEERREQERLERRRKEALDMVVESVRQDLEADTNFAAEPGLPDDDDEADEDEQYERWKLREIRRVKKERDARRAREMEAERRRATQEGDGEPSDDPGPRRKEEEKPKRAFLQRYYHKGAFFQVEDEEGNHMLGDVMKRDFGQATGADRGIDKASLPKVMQVKKFGFRGQTKWTHLSAEDTTQRDALWGDASGGPSRKHASGDSLSRPSSKKPRR